MERLTVACVQLRVGSDPAENANRAAPLVAEAAERGADLVVLPEKWNCLGPVEAMIAAAELPDGPTAELMADWARTNGVILVGGSITEVGGPGKRAANTCLVFDREGRRIALYRKLHMFDVDTPEHRYRESEAERPGEGLVLAEADGWKLGLSICYDLRFPEVYRELALAGAELIAVPAAFTEFTGRDHWQVLLRARAIENQCYVAAAGGWGADGAGRRLYGRSTIVDPWGVPLATAPDADCVILTELSRERMAEIRRSLPALDHRRPDAYRILGRD